MTDFTRRSTLKLGLAGLAGLPLAATAARAASTHEVSIAGFAFDPPELEVAAGDSVVFTNRDGAPHTATAMDGSFDTGVLRKGDSGEITIEAAGSLDYRCSIHPSMKGNITAA